MKAVRMTAVNQPLINQDLPIPSIGDNEVLVRIRAAGICHSDSHYRAGKSAVYPLPMTLGHEISGEVESTGILVKTVKKGDRVCIHYLLSCGQCIYCNRGYEQFCTTGSMLGHYSNGGYAEFIVVPERNVIILPKEISFEQGAILMCSSATSFHALRKSRLIPGETVAVFGVGGLGISAIQIAFAFGALDVFAIDIHPEKLKLAESFGAIPINAAKKDPVTEIFGISKGKGVDVALELIGLPTTMQQAVHSLAIMGRAVIAGISDKPFEVNTYREVLGKEAEIIGSNDHLLHELPILIELVRRGKIDLSKVVNRTVNLDADIINTVLSELEKYSSTIRTVIIP